MNSNKLSPIEIIHQAIQTEKNGQAYYKKIAEATQNEALKNIFNALSKEEENHIDKFKNMEAQIRNSSVPYNIADEYDTPEIYAYIQALSDNKVFLQLDNIFDVSSEITTEKQAICHAISFEKDSVLYYSEMLKMFAQHDLSRETIEALINEEKQHISRLYCLLKKMG